MFLRRALTYLIAGLAGVTLAAGQNGLVVFDGLGRPVGPVVDLNSQVDPWAPGVPAGPVVMVRFGNHEVLMDMRLDVVNRTGDGGVQYPTIFFEGPGCSGQAAALAAPAGYWFSQFQGNKTYALGPGRILWAGDSPPAFASYQSRMLYGIEPCYEGGGTLFPNAVGVESTGYAVDALYPGPYTIRMGPLFSDGFGTGNTERWESTLP